MCIRDRLVDGDEVAQGLGHLVDPIESLEQRHSQHHLRLLAVVLLQLAAHEQVEFLVRAAELHVGIEGHRVVALHERIEQLVQRDRSMSAITRGEIVALEHACERMSGRYLDQARSAHIAEPARIEIHARALRIKDAKDLLFIGARIALHLFGRESRPGRVATARIANQAGEITYEKDDLMSELLECAHLVDEHGVAEVQIRRGRIEAGFDAQGCTCLLYTSRCV